jgi:nascent polypeptide-associated complex subunit alpha
MSPPFNNRKNNRFLIGDHPPRPDIMTKEEIDAAKAAEDHDEDDSSSSDDDNDAQADGDGSRGKQSKMEKKSRKAMAKLGMKPVSGITRATIKKSKAVGSFLVSL